MNIWVIIVVIAVVSVVLSLISLKNLNSRSHVDDAKRKLDRGRVLYQDTSSSSKK